MIKYWTCVWEGRGLVHFYVHELHEVQFEKVGFQSTTEDRAGFGRPDSSRKLIPPPGGEDREQSASG